MDFSSQKTRIAEKIRSIIADIKLGYCERYGKDVYAWDDDEKNLYLLNCDMELIHFLETEELNISENALNNGLTFSIVIIIYECTRFFLDMYGDEMDMYSAESMHRKINDSIIHFLEYGTEEDNDY
jgi:hypothetical protein